MTRPPKYCEYCKQHAEPKRVFSTGELLFGLGLLYILGSYWIMRCPQCRNLELKDIYWSEKKNPEIINDARVPEEKDEHGRVCKLDRSYYELLMNLWSSGQAERDKFWLTISLSGIGVMLALMFSSAPDLIKNMLALIASGYFAVSVHQHWRLLSENALHVEAILFSLPLRETLRKMAFHERWARIAVMNAILSTITLLVYITFSGVAAMENSNDATKSTPAESQKDTSAQRITWIHRPDESHLVAESFAALADMKPASPPPQQQGSSSEPEAPAPSTSTETTSAT